VIGLGQKDYRRQGDLSAPVTLVLEFDSIQTILARQFEWTNYELDNALQKLSDNMWKLQNFLDTVVRFA